MNTIVTNTFLLFYPLILMSVILLLIFKFDHFFELQADGKLEFKISMKFLNISLPVKIKQNILKIMLYMAFIVALLFPVVRDYSFLLPTRFEVHAYFDNDGLQEILNEFSGRDKIGNINLNWKKHKKQWWDTINRDIYNLSLTDINYFFNQTKTSYYSKGETSISLKSSDSLQGYRIVSSSGNLKHFLDKPNSPKKYFDSDFELIDTRLNYVNMSLMDIIKRSKLVPLKYKQIFCVPTRSGSEQRHMYDLLVISEIDLVPILKLSKSIYFIQHDDGTISPVGYCVYTSK